MRWVWVRLGWSDDGVIWDGGFTGWIGVRVTWVVVGLV